MVDNSSVGCPTEWEPLSKHTTEAVSPATSPKKSRKTQSKRSPRQGPNRPAKRGTDESEAGEGLWPLIPPDSKSGEDTADHVTTTVTVGTTVEYTTEAVCPEATSPKKSRKTQKKKSPERRAEKGSQTWTSGNLVHISECGPPIPPETDSGEENVKQFRRRGRDDAQGRGFLRWTSNGALSNSRRSRQRPMPGVNQAAVEEDEDELAWQEAADFPAAAPTRPMRMRGPGCAWY
ncbi:MAG: hypothetical protein M1823_003718 [Watsoniomyces obsoletus]|nr:MAG: hypothetical protein M1823_003718 [Watsoniomyces obsoletus]